MQKPVYQYTPSDTMDGLRKQFFSMQSLLNSQYAQLTSLKEKLAHAETKARETHPDAATLQAERDTNATLTQTVLDLEEKLASQGEELQSLLDQWNEIVQAIGAISHGGAIGHARQLAEFYRQHLPSDKE